MNQDISEGPRNYAPVEEKNTCPCCNGYGYVRIVPEPAYTIKKKIVKKVIIKYKEEDDAS